MSSSDESTVLDETSVAAVVRRAAFDQRGLLPAIIQQHDTGEVLMLGYMDAEALRRTLLAGGVRLWSRSRLVYWRKGDTRGKVQ
jgi:phosphoribosyl-AMP cyclohydrolase